MVVVEKAPDWESRALPGYQPYPSPTCTMILGNALPFLCLGFHVCTVRMLIGKRKHSFGQRGARNARYVPGSVLGAGDTVVNTGPAQSLLAGRQNRRGSQGQDCLKCSNLCWKFTGTPGSSWGSKNREGLVMWRPHHFLPNVFLGPPTPLPPPQLPASEGTS